MAPTTRRTFLTSLLAGATLSTLGTSRAGPPVDNLLIVIFAYGGWDVTYLFDPKPDSAEVDQPEGDWVSYGGLDLWRGDGMQSVARFFEDFGTSCGIVNGVAVGSLVHETCLQNVLGGLGTGPRAGLGVRVAEAAGSHKPLPYLTLGGSAQLSGFEAAAGQLGYSNQLAKLVVPELSPAERNAVDAYLRRAADEVATRRPLADFGVKQLSDYLTSIDRAEAIATSAEKGGWLDDPALVNDFQPWNKVPAALADGFSHAVFVQDDGYWDTHFGNGEQVSLYNGLFRGLRRLMLELEERKLRERTTVLVVSEMGRSPLLNVNQGKDHWPFTSSLIIGEGVRNGMVGTTDPQLAQVALPSGRAIQTQDVLATVATLVGVDAATLYPDAEVLDALLA